MTATQLNWGGNKPHTFYAVYPASNSTLYADGKATFSVKDQTCTLLSRKPVNNEYTITSDPATNAFMVADTTVTPSNNVALHFQPITTTTRIVVNGPSGDGTQNRAILLTGLRIEYPGAFKTFNYDIKTHKLIATESNISDNSRKTLDVSIVDQDKKKTYVNIGHDESAAFNVYLPPVNSDYKGDGTLKVTLLGYGKEGTETVLGTKSYKNFFNDDNYSGKKTRVNLPAALVPTTADPSSWMSTMDDRIYINQLSIPGTHDSEAMEANGTSAAGSLEPFSERGVTQSLSLQDQWQKFGARCFDMRVCPWGTESNPPTPNDAGYDPSLKYPHLWTWHSSYRLRNSFDKEVDALKDLLAKRPGEFSLMIVKFENDVNTFIQAPQKNRDASLFQQQMKSFLDANKDFIIAWRPNLTIGDCRGKIVLLTRYNDLDYIGKTNSTWGWNESGYITGWPAEGMNDKTYNEANSTLQAKLLTSGGTQGGTLYLQDYARYKWNDGPITGTIKYNAINNLLTQTGSYVGNNVSSLVLNYLSGLWYTAKVFNIPELESDIIKSERYKQTAASTNQIFYSRIENNDFRQPTGILMIDYIGDNTNAPNTGSFKYGNVCGDKIAVAVYNQNYKPNLVTLLRAK